MTFEAPSASPTHPGPLALPERREGTEGSPAGPRAGRLYARRGKRTLGLVLLVLTLPVLLAIALPIALFNVILFRDPRRILFSQARVGREGALFWIWKFRTMREEPRAEHFTSWSRGHDGLRVTAFGRFLRNTHLDELPQAINVLRGEMDLVGPRPEMVEIPDWACDVVEGFEERNVLRPGITGLAQVTQGYAGRDAAAYREKLAADREYVRTVSLGTDLLLLLRTVGWVLAGRGWRHERRADLGPVAWPTRSQGDPFQLPATMGSCPRPVSSSTRTASVTTRVRRIRSARID